VFSREQYRALESAAGALHRTDRRVVAVTGADRLTYLQGLLTNDMAGLQKGTGCYAAFLTPQGRMLADMRVVETGERTLIDIHESVAGLVRDRLEQFIFSEDAQVQDLTQTIEIVGVYGPKAASVVEQILTDGPSLPSLELFANCELNSVAGPITIVRSDDIGVYGFDLLIAREQVGSLIGALERAGAIKIDRETAEVTRVEAGRPAWRSDMDEDTIPLEAGIEGRAISLTKGCYVGQEIIIRVLHRGHGRVAKRLVGLALDPDAPVPSSGDPIRSGEREIGSVTSGVFSPGAERPLALGYVHRDFVEPSTRVTIVHDGTARAAMVVKMPVSRSG
jgi:folate-binding protein YgfZ